MSEANPFWSKFKTALKGFAVILALEFAFTVVVTVNAIVAKVDRSGYGVLPFLFIGFIAIDLFYLFCAVLVCFVRSLFSNA